MESKSDTQKPVTLPKPTIAKAGEEAACHYLQQEGYEIICRNWRSGKFAEIDIIARDKSGLIVFVEVKTRRHAFEIGIPLAGFESVNWGKQRKIVIAGSAYLARHRLSPVCRYDVIVVLFEQDDLASFLADPFSIETTIRHVESAVCPF